MSQKEKQSELQVMQLVSSLIAGVLLAFGVSVVVLFVTAHLAAGGKIGTGAVGNAEVIASGLGCFCGSCYLALSYRKRILPLGLATGVLYYLTWTFIGVLGYTDVSLLDGMRSLIAAMPQTTGATVLISSHLLGEIEQMVDQVGILNHGRLLFEGSLQQLQKHSRGGILLRVLDAPKAAAVLQQQGVKAAAPADQPDTLQLPPLPDEALAALVCTLAESGVGVVGLTAQTKSLEDIFLSLTQTSGEVA